MKHLVKFNEMVSKKSFEEITEMEFQNSSMNLSMEHSADSPISKINFSPEEISELSQFGRVSEIGDDKCKKFIQIGGFVYCIYKYPDDWFFVDGPDNIYFRCDEFQGLIDCLHHIKNVK